MTMLDRIQTKDKDMKRFYRLFFLALSAALAFTEYLIPKPLPFLRIGLANAIPVIFLHFGQYRDALFISFWRPVLVCLMIGTLLTPPFWISLTGSLLSILFMMIAHKTMKDFISPIGLCLIGAYFHVAGQLGLVYFMDMIISLQAIIVIGSIMSVMALIGGLITGYISIYLMRHL